MRLLKRRVSPSTHVWKIEEQVSRVSEEVHIDPAEEVLVIGRHDLFRKQAQEDMLCYSILDNNDEIGSSEGVLEEENKSHMVTYLIEKIVKQYKSHCSASDFDKGFINRIIQAVNYNQ